MNVLRKINNLTPSVCLNQLMPSNSNLPLEFGKSEDIGKIENRWRNLLNMDWASLFDHATLQNSCYFWSKVNEMKNAADDYLFRDLSKLALTALSMPISNALVERVFSRVTMVKTKFRYRIGLELLTAILRVRTSLQISRKCCSSFEPPLSMLNYDSSIYIDEVLDEQSNEILEIFA